MGDAHRSASEWRARLKAARNEQEVLAVVRAFLASLTQYEWALLGLQPEAANLECATDLADLSYEVARIQQKRRDKAEVIVSAITVILSDAVTRLAHLGNPRNAQIA